MANIIQVRSLESITQLQASMNEHGADYVGGSTDKVIKFELWLDASEISQLDANANEILDFSFNIAWDNAELKALGWGVTGDQSALDNSYVSYNYNNANNIDFIFNPDNNGVAAIAFSSITASVDTKTPMFGADVIGTEKLIATFYTNPVDQTADSVSLTIKDINIGTNLPVMFDLDDLVVGSTPETSNEITGTTSDDILNGTTGNDIISTLEGADVVYALAGNDTITLTADAVWSSGYVARNVDNSTAVGTNETITLEGLNTFSDVIDGGDDVDTLILTSGNDAFFIDDVYSDHHSSLTLSSTTQGIDSTARVIDLEKINAGEGNDIVDLTSDNFVLTNGVSINGEAGNDTLWGSNGHDTIDGGAGDDTLFGGAGQDTLTGGTGSDIFQFTATSASDVITDFNVTDDTIKLYYRAEDEHTNADLSLSNGVLTWSTSESNNVLIDISAYTNSSDLIDVSSLITFVEIV